jgi:hypothetical protein
MYSYVLGDPINTFDPSGLGPISLPGLVPVDQEQCISKFLPALQTLRLTADQYFNSPMGLLGVTSFFENQASFSVTNIDTGAMQSWGGMDWTIINRFNLSPAGKNDFYGARAPQPVTFAETIFKASDVWTGLNPAAYGAAAAVANVHLKSGFAAQLYNILSGSPDSGLCAGLAVSLGTALRVLQTASGITISPGAEPFSNPFPNALYWTTGGVVPGHDTAHRPVLLGVVDGVSFWGLEPVPISRGRGNDRIPCDPGRPGRRR